MDVLVSWIGHTDLRAMATEQPASVRKRIANEVGPLEQSKDGLGPVRALLDSHRFDRIYLLSNYPSSLTDHYIKWLGQKAVARYPAVGNPTDYGEIFHGVDTEMQKIVAELDGRQYELSILLSPGTPAMAAIWVLLGKTKYPAKFFQTFKAKAWLTDIPFDIAVDLVPELLRGPDSALQHLAAISPRDIQGFETIIGNSKAIRLAVGRARKAAVRDVPVLLTGESGTGKEMFARAIHSASHRRAGPFLAVNCPAIPKPLMESELFGHEKGAFTGADAKYEGAFQRADGGTLFLDEVAECDFDIQAKLLRVLQPTLEGPPCTREFSPLGSSEVVRTDVRLVAATNRDLFSMIDRGAFREDLFYRLAVITVGLPPLRERTSDIPRIADALLAKINGDFERQEPGYRHKALSGSAKSFVARHAWPGNVRELYNALLQAAVMSEKDQIGAPDLQAAIAEMPGGRGAQCDQLELPLGDGFSLEKHLESIHRHYLRRAMHEAGGVKSKAARLLGMKNYQTLDAQLKRLDIRWEKQ